MGFFSLIYIFFVVFESSTFFPSLFFFFFFFSFSALTPAAGAWRAAVRCAEYVPTDRVRGDARRRLRGGSAMRGPHWFLLLVVVVLPNLFLYVPFFSYAVVVMEKEKHGRRNTLSGINQNQRFG